MKYLKFSVSNLVVQGPCQALFSQWQENLQQSLSEKQLPQVSVWQEKYLLEACFDRGLFDLFYWHNHLRCYFRELMGTVYDMSITDFSLIPLALHYSLWKQLSAYMRPVQLYFIFWYWPLTCIKTTPMMDRVPLLQMFLAFFR
jgi:hypothetical protein